MTSSNAPRLVRTYVQRIEASPAEVFPLLCPVREREWLPGWDSHIIYSDSGVAERGAVFESAHDSGKTLWIITGHEPNRRVEFARWQPDGLAVHIEIVLATHVHGETAVGITYTYTAASEAGIAALARLSDEAWHKQMTYWESSMNQWFRNQRAAR